MKKRGRPAKTYAIYKGEIMVAMGTIKELAKQTGVKESTLRFQTSPAYQKRGQGRDWKAVFPLD